MDSLFVATLRKQTGEDDEDEDKDNSSIKIRFGSAKFVTLYKIYHFIAVGHLLLHFENLLRLTITYNTMY